jgi:hypothetical protein
MISSVIDKEFIENSSSNISILISDDNDRVFKNFIIKTCDPCSIITFGTTYYGNETPNLIICNNRISDLNKCNDLALFFHCGLLIVDNQDKPDIINNKISSIFIFNPVYQIATSQRIYLSWNKIQNKVLSYDMYNANSISIWRNLIYNLIKQPFMLTEQEMINGQKIEQNNN